MSYPFTPRELKENLIEQMYSIEKVFLRADGSEHDRTTTAGASELSGCLRSVGFSKSGTPKDLGYRETRGYALRGDVIENHFAVPLLHKLAETYGAKLILAGEDQRTLVSGRMSATPDGVLVFPNGVVVNIEIKSFDPRAHIPLSGKPNHRIQNIVQMGLLREAGYPVELTLLAYFNASNFEDIRIVEVGFDPEAYEHMKLRAEMAFESEPHLLPAEGATAGDCQYCAYTEACGQAIRSSMPSTQNPELPAEQVAELEALVSELKQHESVQADTKRLVGEVREALKIFLRQADAKAYRGDDYEISYTRVAGRESLDRKALEAAGVDLTPYLKRSDDSDRLTVKFS